MTDFTATKAMFDLPGDVLYLDGNSLGPRPRAAPDRVTRMRAGTPPIIQMAALETAPDLWDLADIANLRARSIELTDLFIDADDVRKSAAIITDIMQTKLWDHPENMIRKRAA